MTLAYELVTSAVHRRAGPTVPLVRQVHKACYRKEEPCPKCVFDADAGHRCDRENQSQGGCR